MPADNQAGMNDLGGGPMEWLNSLPIVTRTWFKASLGLTVLGNLGAIDVFKLIYHFPALKDNFEIWRLVTPFCYIGPFEFNTLITLMTMVQFGKQYEAGGPYNTGAGGGTADFAFMILFCMVVMLLSFPFLPLVPLFTQNLVFAVIYVWSKRHPHNQASIWGIPIPAMYLPFAYLAFNLLLGNPWYGIAHGIAVGHLYYFLVDIVPNIYGKDYLHTPQFMIDFFGVGEYVPPTPAAAPMGRGRTLGAAGARVWAPPGRVNSPNDPASTGSGARGGGHRWGGGRTLGTE